MWHKGSSITQKTYIGKIQPPRFLKKAVSAHSAPLRHAPLGGQLPQSLICQFSWLSPDLSLHPPGQAFAHKKPTICHTPPVQFCTTLDPSPLTTFPTCAYSSPAEPCRKMGKMEAKVSMRAYVCFLGLWQL